jgi:hypothetical protein
MKVFQKILYWLGLVVAVAGITGGVASSNSASAQGAIAIAVGAVALVLASQGAWR